MPVLELPGGGITRPKYDRVIANSLEELVAFTPEVPHVWGMVRGQFTRRYWDGVEWKVAGVIGSGPLANAPVASLYPAGVMWWDDVVGKIYQCDYAGNFVNNGSATLADRVQPTTTFNPNNDFSLKIAFRQDNAALNYTGLYTQSTNGVGSTNATRSLFIERVASTASYQIAIYSGSTQQVIATVPSIIDGVWHLLEIIRVGNLVEIKKDGALVNSIAPIANINIPLFTSIGSQPTLLTINGQICCVEAVAPIGSFKYRFNQLSGTVIQDLSGNGNTGTLTDGSPATFSGNKYWIPRELISCP